MATDIECANQKRVACLFGEQLNLRQENTLPSQSNYPLVSKQENAGPPDFASAADHNCKPPITNGKFWKDVKIAANEHVKSHDEILMEIVVRAPFDASVKWFDL